MSNLRPVPLGHPLMTNSSSEPHPAAVAAANAMAAAAAASSASHTSRDNAANTANANDANSDAQPPEDAAAQQAPSADSEQANEQSQPQQQQPPAPSATLAPIPDTLDELHAQESHVDAELLKTAGNLSTTTPYTLPAGTPALGPFGLAHARSPFVLTVLAVHAIVSGKLYKHAGANLEDYFKSRFGISRAQVYRVLDCAALYMDFELRFPSLPLHLLEPYPLKQRLCKTIRSLAPTPYLRQLLWHCTLRKWVVPPPPPARAPIIRREVVVNSDGEEEEIEVEHVVPPPLPAAVISVDELTSKHVRDVWDLLVLRADVRQLLELAITQVNDMYNGATVPVPTSGAAAAAAAGAANTASSSGVAATDDPTAAGSSNDDTETTAANGDVSGATSTSNLSTSSTATDQPTPPGGASLGLIQGPLGMELPSIPYVAIDTYTPRSMRDRSPNSGDPRPTKRPRRSSTAGASGGRGRRGSYSSASAASSSAATAASPTAPAFNPADMLLGGGGNPPSPHSPAFQPLSTRPDGASHFAPPLASPTDLASLMDDPMDLTGSGSATLAPDTSAAAYSWNQITSQYANATAASLAAYGRAGPPPAPAPPEINYSRLRADSPRSLSPLGESDEEEMVMRRAQMEKAGHDGQMGAEEEQAADKNQPQSEAPPPAPAAANKIARPLPPPPAAFAMATPQSRSGMPSPLLIHQGHVVNGASGEAGTVPNGSGLRVNPIVRPASLHSTAGLPPPPPQSSNASGALTSSGTTSHARSHNGNEPNGGANPGDSPVFSLPMVPPSSAAIADQALLVPSSTSSPSFLPHPLTQPALFPMHHMHHHAHALSNLTHLPLPPPPPPPPPARTVADLDINSTEMHDFLCNTIESLQELARRGVVLQPLVNSVWLNDVTHWRFYTMQNAQAQGGAGSGQAAASETVGATRVGTGASADGQQGSGAGADAAGGAELERHGNGSVTSAGVAQGLQVNGLDLADTPVSSSSAAPAPATMTTTRARPLAVPAAPPARLATSGSAAMPRSDSGMALPLTAVGPAGQLMMMPPTSMPGSVEMGFGQQQQQHWASGSAANGFANGEWMMQGGKPDVLGSWQGPFGQQRQQQDQSDH